MTSTNKIILGIVFLAAAGSALWLAAIPPRVEEQSCTMEAKQCPDGSYVGRMGPNCEFTACPADTSIWKSKTDAKAGIAFQYPEKLSTAYIDAVDWPPQVIAAEGPFLCSETGTEEGRAGRTEHRMVDDRTYCVTEVAGAAAGSRYSQYAYAFEKNGKIVIFTFSLRFPECANYADPSHRTACEGERETFDIDGVVDRMARTVK